MLYVRSSTDLKACDQFSCSRSWPGMYVLNQSEMAGPAATPQIGASVFLAGAPPRTAHQNSVLPFYLGETSAWNSRNQTWQKLPVSFPAGRCRWIHFQPRGNTYSAPPLNSVLSLDLPQQPPEPYRQNGPRQVRKGPSKTLPCRTWPGLATVAVAEPVSCQPSITSSTSLSLIPSCARDSSSFCNLGERYR